ncbi:MAG: hypothetical protein ACT6VE_34600, partial [Shinella sp.]
GRAVATPQVQQQPRRNMFSGLRLNASAVSEPAAPTLLERAVTRYGKAAQEIVRMREQGFEPLVHQRKAFDNAKKELDTVRSGSAEDMRKAMNADRSLIADAAQGRTAGAISAMERQANMRIREQRIAAQNERRADAFVDSWQRESACYEKLRKGSNAAASNKVRASLVDMAKGLERDPQLESLLANRRPQLGLDAMSTKPLSQDLQKSLGLSRGLGMGM